jgi:hypothetical protein
METPQQQVQIRAENNDLKGHYSNIAQILHTKEEFIIDFLLTAPSGVSLLSRIIMSPGHIKRMISALQGNLKIYEDKFGSVEQAEEPKTEIGFKN